MNLSSMQAQRDMFIFLMDSRKGPESHSINRTLELERLIELARDYQKAANDKKLIENGWIDDWITNYSITKLFTNAITRIYEGEKQERSNIILVDIILVNIILVIKQKRKIMVFLLIAVVRDMFKQIFRITQKMQQKYQ